MWQVFTFFLLLLDSILRTAFFFFAFFLFFVFVFVFFFVFFFVGQSDPGSIIKSCSVLVQILGLFYFDAPCICRWCLSQGQNRRMGRHFYLQFESLISQSAGRYPLIWGNAAGSVFSPLPPAANTNLSSRWNPLSIFISSTGIVTCWSLFVLRYFEISQAPIWKHVHCLTKMKIALSNPCVAAAKKVVLSWTWKIQAHTELNSTTPEQRQNVKSREKKHEPAKQPTPKWFYQGKAALPPLFFSPDFSLTFPEIFHFPDISANSFSGNSENYSFLCKTSLQFTTLVKKKTFL